MCHSSWVVIGLTQWHADKPFFFFFQKYKYVAGATDRRVKFAEEAHLLRPKASGIRNNFFLLVRTLNLTVCLFLPR